MGCRSPVSGIRVYVAFGKIGALVDVVTVESESASSPERWPMREGRPQETRVAMALRIRVAERLKGAAREIAERWETQARSVALRDLGESSPTGQESVAVALVDSLATALASDGATSEDMVARGLALGAEACESGASLHHTLKGLDLLSAMTLYAVEAAVAEEAVGEPVLADAVRLCRRLQQGTSLLALATAKGYTRAADDEMRDRFRRLRHDLKNPLGTIRSVLALMDDETIPLEERSNPRFRAMAKRNARSLGELIAERLSDAEAVLRTHPVQMVSLRTVTCAVRRDLRTMAMACGATVLVSGTKVRVQVDAIGLELLLHELLYAALQESGDGDELSVDFGETENDRVTVRLGRRPNRPPITERAVLERLGTLAIEMGAKLDASEQLVLSYPVQHPLADLSRYLPVIAAVDVSPQSGSGDPRHDVRSTRQREHGQSGSL